MLTALAITEIILVLKGFCHLTAPHELKKSFDLHLEGNMAANLLLLLGDLSIPC